MGGGAQPAARVHLAADWLAAEGFNALPYHAGLDAEVRKRHQERFLREARSMAQLNDAHIIQIYFIGEDNGQPFFAMELLEGSIADAARVKEIDPSMFTKSGLMVGLGETREEILQVMDDLRAADVDFLTVGQYLQPTPKHAALDRFWTPAEFDELAKLARAKGFLMVSASPLTRSSYHAGDDFARLRAARVAQLGR